VSAAKPVPGKCHFCGCHGDSCKLATGGDDRCTWLGVSRTVCTNPMCIRAHYADRDRVEVAAKKARRKRTPAEIHQLMIEERRERRHRSRKGRAA
jgi:hypothetical protein